MPIRILICPDKFKGTLTGSAAAEAIAAGVRAELPDAEIRTLPIADGGEGTLDAVLAVGAEEHEVDAHDPLGRPVRAHWASLDERAVIELASASGLALVDPTPTSAATSDTYGTGEVILAALDAGHRDIVIGLGGSASTDGGTGLLRALGARFLDTDGRELPPGGAALTDLAHIDLSRLDPRLEHATVSAFCDVQAPLLGPSGAAAVFGPQKGADPATVETLERGLAALADLLTEATGIDVRTIPWGGAAGGTSAGLHGALRADFAQGVDQVADLLDLDTHLAWADVLIVGEGSLDEQSLTGKAPIGLAHRAHRAGVPTFAVAGRVTAPANKLAHHGILASISATDAAGSSKAALADAVRWTTDATRTLVRNHISPLPDPQEATR